MTRRALFLGIVLLITLGALLVLRFAPRRVEIQPAASPGTIAAAMATRRFDATRLPPDGRFLDAVAIVRRVVRGPSSDTAGARYRDGRWTVSFGAATVATLSEIPTFAELRGALVSWAVTLGARDSFAACAPVPVPARKTIEAELAALHALRAADAIERAWTAGARTRESAIAGARSLAWLSAECLDAVGAADPLNARAWAWNAIASALDSTGLDRETALLAAVLGYPAEAWQAAGRLAADDPIGLYVRREDRRLEARAATRAGGREAAWLAVRRCVERRDLERWEVAVAGALGRDSVLALPVLGSALALGRFESDLGAAALTLAAVASELKLGNRAEPAEAGEHAIARMMDQFESLLAASPASADGALLGRDVIAAWYRASFYSALFRIGDHLRNQLSDVGGTQEFAKLMSDGAGVAGPAGEFERWFWHLAALKRGEAPGSDQKRDLARTRSFGARLASVTFDAIRENSPGGSPYVRWCARFMQRQLDSRPEHLALWGWILWDDLGDVADSEELRAAAARSSHPLDFESRAEWAAYAGDHAALDSLADARVNDPLQTMYALEYLRREWPEDSARVDRGYEQLIAEHPGDWMVTRPHVLGLAERHRDARARGLIQAWLRRADRSQRALEEADARVALAKSFQADGLWQQAYDAIHPALSSMKGSALLTGAELLDRLGRGAEAETLAVVAWQRYVDSPGAQALVVDLLWRHGRYELAAGMLADAPQPLAYRDWRWTLGPRFAVFEREHPAEARHALDAIAAVHLDDWGRLGSLIAALADAGRNASAAELIPRVRTAGGAWDPADLTRLLFIYRNVKAARGAAAAADWLRKNLPAQNRNTIGYLHLAAYSAHDDEVLWVLPIVGDDDDREDLWLMRVAAMVRDTAGTPEQRAGASRYFAQPAASRYHHYARLLLGLETEADILALPGTMKAASEAAYFFGLERQIHGDYRSAASWYERCVELNVPSNGEHQWALQQLSDWVGRRRSLERIAAEHGWPAAGGVRPPDARTALSSAGATPARPRS